MVKLFKFYLFIILLFATVAGKGKDRGIANTANSPYAKLRSVDIDDVRWTKGFWAEKFDQCHKVMIPNMWDVLSDPERAHAWQNFRIAAGLENGEFRGNWWMDGDFYKWIEASSYVYALTKDKKLDKLMDKVIAVIKKAQQKDGYIHTPTIIGHGTLISRTKQTKYSNQTERWQNLGKHELYCMGHLMTAACIHYRATGKTNFLDIAKKTGDYLYKTFVPCPPELAHFGFNPSNIMGAVELYRTTKDPKYLTLAKTFVDMRGSAPGGTDQNQDRVSLRQETEAVGHAVTANYLYAGAADVYAEIGDKTLLDALERIWQDVVFKKMYITGATGALHQGVSPRGDKVHEAYGREYQLPNSTAYNETCANIANAMWNWRMLALSGQARFADIMELVLYNSALSGISIDGKNFFYTNVLRRTKGTPFLSWDLATRQSYLTCFCCPPNIVRTIAKAHGWAYSLSDEGVWINLYGSNILETEMLDGSKLKLIQETDYPWDGEIKITVDSPKKKEFSIMLRIPGWTKQAYLKVNGRAVNEILKPGTYQELRRIWKKGDLVELNLLMKPQLIIANPFVEEVRNQVAIKRGPIVYCLESPDLPDGVRVSEVIIPRDIELKSEYKKDFLGGVDVLIGEAFYIPQGNWTNKLYRKRQAKDKKPITIKLIPYFTWSNRGESEMTVWMPLVR